MKKSDYCCIYHYVWGTKKEMVEHFFNNGKCCPIVKKIEIKNRHVGNARRRSGFSYEHRFVEKLRKSGATDVIRHYGSLGITDIEWKDELGIPNEAQLKFSSTKITPTLNSKDMIKIQRYAKTKMKPFVKIWVVCKASRKKEVWEAIN